MDDFKVMYRVLKYLQAALDCDETDPEAFSTKRLKVSENRLEQLLIIMQDEGLIKGLTITRTMSDSKRHIVEPIKPEITLKGLEYLQENSMMKKAANLAKGVREMLP